MKENFKNIYNRTFTITLAFISIVLIGMIDYYSGASISFSIFYLIPIFIIAWKETKNIAIFISILSSIIWVIADNLAGNIYTNLAIPIWNAFVRLIFFIISIHYITEYKKRLKTEEELADTDFLTGVFNARAFYEYVEMEINRCSRYQHPFSVAYLDLDNFKRINDTHGHTIGDKLLITTTAEIKTNIRATDICGRLGGDEFAIIFPETNKSAADSIIKSLQRKMLTAMKDNQWDVTFSIGIITFETSPSDVITLIKEVDNLMYSVKKAGKNNIASKVYKKNNTL